MLITLTKLGRNCQVVFYNQSNDNTQTFQEDSANVECTYNVLNDVVSVAIKGRTQATTTSIVDNNVLYINTGSGDILIKTYSDYLINYALLFLNAGGTGGGVNPTSTVIPVNIAGSFVDSNIYNIPSVNYIATYPNTATGDTGLSLDLIGRISKLGDFANNGHGTFISINDVDYTIKTFFENSEKGLSLDFINNLYQFGDFTNLSNGTSLVINDSNKLIVTKFNGSDCGLSLDGLNGGYYIGDFGTTNQGTNLVVNDSLGTIRANFGGYAYGKGLFLDFTNNIYQFGDFQISNIGTYLTVDDQNGRIYANYASGNVIGINLDFTNKIYQLGDFNGSQNGNFITIDNNNRKISTYDLGSEKGIGLNFVSDYYWLGDFNGSTNNNFIKVDNAAYKLYFASVAGKYNFLNIQAYTDNADALANGLIVGDIYRHDAGGLESADQLRIVH